MLDALFRFLISAWLALSVKGINRKLTNHKGITWLCMFNLAVTPQMVKFAVLRKHATSVVICSNFFAGCAPRPGLAKIKSPWPKSFRKFLNSRGVNHKTKGTAFSYKLETKLVFTLNLCLQPSQ